MSLRKFISMLGSQTAILNGYPPEPPSITMPTTFDVYIDSTAPNGGDGSFGSPFNTLPTPVANTSYGIKRGSCFRAEFYGYEVNGLTIGVYGSGNRPIFDCADIASNANFSKTSGRTNIYQITWTNNFRPGNPCQHSVWEDTKRLFRCVDLDQCDSIPGSYFVGTPTNGGSDTIYVHPTGSGNPVSNSKVYEITKREGGIWVGDNSKVYSVHTKRNGLNDGSFRTGINAYAYDVIAEDGVKHNIYFEEGLAEYCTAWKADFPQIFGGATMWICYSGRNTPALLNVTLKNCNCIAQFNDSTDTLSGMIGLYSHRGGVSQYSKVIVDGGFWSGGSVTFSGELANGMEVKNAYVIGGASSLIDGNFIDGGITLTNNILYGQVSVNNDALILNNNKGKFSVRKFYGDATITATNNTSRNTGADNNFIELLGADPTNIILSNNILTGARVIPVAALNQTDAAACRAAISAINNRYSGGDAYNFINYVTYNSLTEETGLVKNVSESDYTGSTTNGDFFLPTSHPAYTVAGSESTFDGVVKYPTLLLNEIENWKLIIPCGV